MGQRVELIFGKKSRELGRLLKVQGIETVKKWWVII